MSDTQPPTGDSDAEFWAHLTGLPIVRVERDGDAVLLATTEDDPEVWPVYTFNAGSAQLGVLGESEKQP